jgi:hypothetical protein
MRYGRQRIIGSNDSRAPVRRRKHGLTADEQDALLVLQGGHCAACPETRGLQLDHDHRHCPGAVGCRHCVRGYLCRGCNQALGGVEDNPATLKALIAYLERTA